MDFLDETFLPLYGISSLCDTVTEISSDKLSKFDEMTACIPEIQRLFKVSSMNLSRSDYKINRNNAIPILKHMCVQCRIPYDITKYSSYYTFALAPENMELSVRRKKLKTPIIMEVERTLQDVRARPKKAYPYSYFQKLPCKFIPDAKLSNTNSLSSIRVGFDYYNDNIDWIDKSVSHAFTLMAAQERNKTSSVSYPLALFNPIEAWYEHRGRKFISIPLTCAVDIYHTISSIKLYDQNGRCIKETDRADMTVQTFYVVKKNITTLSLFIWSMPYTYPCLLIPYDGPDPAYYRVELIAQTILNEERKKLCSNWLDMDVRDGKIFLPDTQPAKNIRVRWRGTFYVPRCGDHFTLQSDDEITVTYSNNYKFTKNNPRFPLPTYNPVGLVSEDNGLCEAIIDYELLPDEYPEHELVVLDGDEYHNQAGVLLNFLIS